MPLTPPQRLLSLLARADQLVAEADELLATAESPEQWVHAEDLREILVEMQAVIEQLQDRYGGQHH